MKKQIQAWLSNPQAFNEGLKLYELAGGQAKLRELKLIAAKPFLDRSDKTLLIDLLTILLDTIPEAEVNENAVPIQAVAREDEPASIKRLRTEGIKWKKRESYIHGQMVAEAKGNGDQEKLHGFAKEMMEEIQPNLNRIYNAIRDYEQNGTLPPSEQQKIISETLEKITKRDSARTRIYRLRKILKSEKDESLRKKYLDEIELKSQEIKEVETFLGM